MEEKIIFFIDFIRNVISWVWMELEEVGLLGVG